VIHSAINTHNFSRGLSWQVTPIALRTTAA